MFDKEQLIIAIVILGFLAVVTINAEAHACDPANVTCINETVDFVNNTTVDTVNNTICENARLENATFKNAVQQNTIHDNNTANDQHQEKPKVIQAIGHVISCTAFGATFGGVIGGALWGGPHAIAVGGLIGACLGFAFGLVSWLIWG